MGCPAQLEVELEFLRRQEVYARMCNWRTWGASFLVLRDPFSGGFFRGHQTENRKHGWESPYVMTHTHAAVTPGLKSVHFCLQSICLHSDITQVLLSYFGQPPPLSGGTRSPGDTIFLINIPPVGRWFLLAFMGLYPCAKWIWSIHRDAVFSLSEGFSKVPSYPDHG